MNSPLKFIGDFNMNMFNLTNDINEMVKETMALGGEKEVISKTQSEKAKDIISSLYISDEKDVLLFCSALNLLNTYVKQADSDIDYAFKGAIGRLLIALRNSFINNIQLDYFPKQNSLLIVQIHNIQFSFHCLRKTKLLFDMVQKYSSTLEWDGLRKQSCAGKIFNIVYNTQY